MNGQRPVLIVIAFAQAIAIVLLAWSMFGGTNAVAGPSANLAAGEPAVVVPVTSAIDSAPVDVEVAKGTAQAPELASTQPPIGTLVHGSVRGEGDSVLPSANVSLLRGDSTKPLFSSSLQRGRSQFAWPDIAVGDYELRANAGGFGDYVQTFTIAAGAPDLRIEVVLKPSWLVKVLLLTPDGKPWHETLEAIRKDKPFFARLGSTEAVQVLVLWHEFPREMPTADLGRPLTIAKWRDGELTARYAGVLEMPERRAAYAAVVFQQVVLATAPLPAGQEELTFTIDPASVVRRMATLRVQVVDRDGKPLVAAKVGIDEDQSWRQPATVGRDGRLELTELLPGESSLSVSCEGYATQSYAIVLAPGAVIDLGTMVLLPQRDLRIEVQEAPEGDALHAWLMPLGGTSHASLRHRATAVWLRNSVATVRVAEGRYRLLLSGAGAANVEFDTRTLGDQPLVVKLQTEVAIDFDPASFDGPTRVVLRAVDGARVFDFWTTSRTRWQQKVLPGTYTVTVQPLVGAAREQRLVVSIDGVSCTL